MRVLGSGGFGDVVLARHEGSGTLVAVKYLRRELLADPGFAAMFQAEARVLGSLQDPNVVRLYEYVESPAGAAIVMELVDGVSVREILSRQGRTSAEAALVVLQGSLLGLAAAHARGVVHRDYKPANVLVDGRGVSKLTDFGIAARTGDRPVPAGTLAYAPPEQLAGAPASPAGDVYAATVTFYECLAGRPPFSGDSVERVLYQQLYEPVPLEAVPEPLRPLLTTGLAREPADRPADAAAFVTTLRAVAGGAYGPDWENRGRSHLAGAALLLAALWPSGTTPALQGSTTEHLRLARSQPGQTKESRHLRHEKHLRHLAHLRHLRAILAVTAAAAVGAVALVVAAPWKGPAPVLPPTGLTADSSTASSAGFRWSAPATGPRPDHYEIVRDGQVIGAVPGNVTRYQAMGLAPDTSYQFQVIAIRGAEHSPDSAELSVMTLRRTPTESAILSGTWTGTYYCSQGETGLRLTMQASSDGRINATFNFYAVPSNPDVPSGSFAMTGSYSAAGVVLTPDYWISEPSGYEMVDLTGRLAPGNQNVLEGQITTFGCGTFSVQKS